MKIVRPIICAAGAVLLLGAAGDSDCGQAIIGVALRAAIGLTLMIIAQIKTARRSATSVSGIREKTL